MFTIKFYNDDNYYNCVEVPNYNVSRFKAEEGCYVVEVTVYQDYTTQDGVSYLIADKVKIPHFKGAYVTNSKGKTVDHIRAMS